MTTVSSARALTPRSAWLPMGDGRGRDGIRLFCFPYAGGGASAYREWQAGLGDRVLVCPVQLPGRETRLRETPFTDLHALADAAVDALWSYFEPPYAFFGHSMGALLAFEVARRIRDAGGAVPGALLLSGCAAPDLFRIRRPLHVLPRAELIAELAALDGTPAAALANDELFSLVEPAIRADFTMCHGYTFSEDERLATNLSVFAGSEDAWVSEQQAAAWSRHTHGGFLMEVFPGNHFFVRSSQAELLARTASWLETTFSPAGNTQSLCRFVPMHMGGE